MTNFNRFTKTGVAGETKIQSRLDLFLGLAFLIISIFAIQRCWSSWQSFGGRKIISIFNTLILISAVTRSIWFLIPSDFLEGSYDPSPFYAYSTRSPWRGFLLSEMLLMLGSYALYGVFILIACYWSNMLKKMEPANLSESQDEANDLKEIKLSKGESSSKASSDTTGQSVNTLSMFYNIMLIVAAVGSVNIFLFLCQKFNSIQLILYDSVTLSILSFCILFFVYFLSQQINNVLVNMEIINQSSSKAQIRRIYAIVVLAMFFFGTRVLLECLMAFSMAHVMITKNSINVSPSEPYWTLYIATKHSTEVLVLLLELMVSTAIKSYDNSRVTIRQMPKIVPRTSIGSSYEAPKGNQSRLSGLEEEFSIKRNISNVGRYYGSIEESSRGYYYESLPVTPIESDISELAPIIGRTRGSFGGSNYV